MKQRPVGNELERPPNLSGVKGAVGNLKNRKTVRISALTPDMIKTQGRNEEFIGMVWDTVNVAWEERKVSGEGGCHANTHP